MASYVRAPQTHSNSIKIVGCLDNPRGPMAPPTASDIIMNLSKPSNLHLHRSGETGTTGFYIIIRGGRTIAPNYYYHYYYCIRIYELKRPVLFHQRRSEFPFSVYFRGWCSLLSTLEGTVPYHTVLYCNVLYYKRRPSRGRILSCTKTKNISFPEKEISA